MLRGNGAEERRGWHGSCLRKGRELRADFRIDAGSGITGTVSCQERKAAPRLDNCIWKNKDNKKRNISEEDSYVTEKRSVESYRKGCSYYRRSSGIGLGVCELLSAYGAKIAMVDISPKGEEKAKELRDAGREAAFFQCDVTNEEQVKKTVDAIVAKYGKIDILHNNAGVTVRKTIADLTEKEWDFVLDVGLKGLFLSPSM